MILTVLPEGEGSCWALRQFTEFWAHSVRCAYSLSRLNGIST